jgi:hypothetical protein
VAIDSNLCHYRKLSSKDGVHSAEETLHDDDVVLIGGAFRTTKKQSSSRQSRSELIVVLHVKVLSTPSRSGDSR